MSFWAIELSGVSSRVSYTLRHFSSFHRWIRCLTKLFTERPTLFPYLLRPTLFVFHFHLTLWNSIGLRPIPKPTQFSTKSNANSVPCTHTNVMQCYCTPMQYNLCHCTQTHDQCMKTSTWTLYTVHYVCAMNNHV